MERLNLYRGRSRVVPLKAVVVFLLIMILPGIGGRFFLEAYWKYVVHRIKGEHVSIIKATGIPIRGNREDITRLDGMISRYVQSYAVFVKQRKDIIEFLKSAYFSKRVLSAVFNNLRKDEKSWMMVMSMDFYDRGLDLAMYEIYSNDRKSRDIVRELRKIGKVSENVVFDVNMSGGKNLSKVVINLVH